MRSYCASRAIPATPERAWELISDTGLYPVWVAHTVAMLSVDGAADIGVTYRERSRILGPLAWTTHWTVTEYLPLVRQVHHGTGLPFVTDLSIEFDLIPEQDRRTTTVGFTISFMPTSAVLGRLFGGLAATVLRERQRRSLDMLAHMAGGHPVETSLTSGATNPLPVDADHGPSAPART
ncbi:SRPBCC family protein [Nocardia sp. NPDC087230]|uniref:SRPBCC family protein n=1 Tax=Nocardia sp. NPDC087230 TaxID=3364331 RepID=UPI003816FDE2